MKKRGILLTPCKKGWEERELLCLHRLHTPMIHGKFLELKIVILQVTTPGY